MIKMVVFDFDGTLCDNFEEMMDSFDEVVEKYGCSFGESNKEILKNKGAKAFFESLGVDQEQTKTILEEVRALMLRKATSLRLFEGVKEIESIKNKGLKIGILSSSPKEYVTDVLKLNEADFFDFVVFEDNVFGKDKAIKELVDKNGLDPEETAYVGDENRDIEAANKAGVVSVAVTWGYNNEHLLIESKPSKTVKSFEELVNLFN
jgi:phosphoglycolate phosphatase